MFGAFILFILNFLLHKGIAEFERVFNVSESVPVGHIIGYINGTSSGGIQPNYYIIYPDESVHTDEYLTVEDISGEISVKSPLDYETRSGYEILAIPTDGSNAIQIYVRITDENDHTPNFPVPSINIEISEYARLHSEISLPAALDADSEPFSVKKYSIVSGNVNNAFRLSTKQLNSMLYVDLVVNGQLDREYRNHYDLLIEAVDGGSPPRVGTLKVNLTVLDTNDNAPEFSQTKYIASVPWNATVGHIVTTVHAVDADLGINAEVSYSIVKNHPNAHTYFSIDPKSGVVVVAENNLTAGATYDVLIAASDHGLPQPLESTVFLSVSIERSAEKRPYLDIVWLTDSGMPEAFENITLGYVLARISLQEISYDSLLSMNEAKLLCLKQTDSFYVYLLIVCGQLDREMKSSYSLVFNLTDGNKSLLEYPVHFDVLDVNDNAPRFPHSSIDLTFNKSSDPFDVIRIVAKDEDIGENARISYSVLDTNTFNIERDTGILRIEKELDCSSQEVRFRVNAKDNGTPPLSTTIDVSANVIDGNNRSPVFSKPLYEVSVKEDAEQGTCILKVLARNNCGSNSGIRYSIQDQISSRNVFNINDQTGTICLERSLDYETTRNYQITVEARDINSSPSRTLVNIHVEDVNDNSPTFYPSSYNVSVREDAEIGTPILMISAKDADEGIFGEVQYNIISGNHDAFKLEPQSGKLYVQSKITLKSYEIIVQAIDGGGLTGEQKANIHINVIQPSTPVPQFTKTMYKMTVAEDLLPGISIGKVEAMGPYRITYNIYSGDPDQMFAIDSNTGKIIVNKYLDGDKWNIILLNIQASMENGGTNHTQVTIEILDINDNDPEFLTEKVEAYVFENHTVHRPFFSVQAFDKDREKNGEINYSILQCEPSCPITILTATGELVLNSNLDYELVQKYQMIIRAKDLGVPPRSSTVSVTVNVIDVNDNAPKFEQNFFVVEISEDAPLMHTVFVVRATDADADMNAKITFQLVDETEHFDIHPYSGIIFLKTLIDREEHAQYKLTVIAKDRGNPQLSSTCTIKVQVLDVNDNSPNCSTALPIVLTDDVPVGVPFAKVNILDPDEGENGTVIYRDQNDPNFSVNPDGEISLKKLIGLSYSINGYILPIIASDSDKTEPRSSICELQVIYEIAESKVKIIKPYDRIVWLDDHCNKNCPLKKLNATNAVRWELEPNEISRFFKMVENVLWTNSNFERKYFKTSRSLSVSLYDSDDRKKQLILSVRPIKKLSHVNDNSTIMIRIVGDVLVGTKLRTIGERKEGSIWILENKTDMYYLDEETSDLYLMKSLESHSDLVHTLNISLFSINEHIKENFVVYVEVENEQISRPKFQNCPTKISLSENETIGKVIFEASAISTTEASAENFIYKIVETSLPLNINPRSGKISTLQALQWRSDILDYAVLEVENRGINSNNSKSSRCILYMKIEDTNNNAPIFESPSEIVVDDDWAASEHTNYIVATDPDDGIAGKVKYEIIGGNENRSFSISETGKLKIDKRIRKSEFLLIRAYDSGRPSLSTVQNLTIRYKENNRKWKFFKQLKYNFILNVANEMKEIELHDFFAESINKAHLQIFLKSAQKNNTVLIINNGKLYAKPFMQGLFGAVVLARNTANQVDWNFIELKVIGGNHFSPKIQSASCGNLSVPENKKYDNLFRIYAVDEDEGKNSLIEYKIVAGNEHDAFLIDRSTGVISCKELDREFKSEYFLVITAEDQGTPAKGDTCTVRITVIDENDNAPIFDDSFPNSVEISDEIEVGTVLLRITANDLDQGYNSEIHYRITDDPSGLLDINADTGELIFARSHRTIKNEYVVSVMVMDNGKSQALFAEKSFTLKLNRELWKNFAKPSEPSFLSQNYVGYVKESQSRGEFVLKISSTDRLTNDAPLVYSIVNGNIDGAFDITNDGQIFTAQELDREIEEDYNLNIIGNSSYKKSPVTRVHIRVLNVNDNPPLLSKMQPLKISENALIGTLLTTAIATDVDDDSSLEFSISNNDGPFEINRFSGNIFLSGCLDYETMNEHILEIMVTDGEYNSTTLLTVEVIDENDNAPVFENDIYEISLSHEAEVGSVLASIKATDKDSGLNGQISYSFSKNTSEFEIDENNGNIMLRAKISESLYLLELRAIDKGTPSLNSIVPLVIYFIDIGQIRKPRFDKRSYSFSIPENLRANIPFGTIPVSDVSGYKLFYSVLEKDLNEIFGIDHHGSLSLKKSIDREKRTDYKFTVLVYYTPNVNATTTVYIEIVDVNDNNPIIAANPNKIFINEYTKIGEPLSRIIASDRDGPGNNELKYHILAGNDYDMFYIDEKSGDIFFKKWNEECLMGINQYHENLTIITVDNGQPKRWNITQISVQVESNMWSGTAPFFVMHRFSKSVFEDHPKNEVLLKPRAVNRLGILMFDWLYSLTDNDELFICNPTTGDIMIRENLDYESRTVYFFSLVVKDNRSRSAVVPVQINVLGVDEYPPVFMKNSYKFQIPFSARIGQRIAIVSATDQDSGPDGVIRYEIEGNAMDYLKIDRDSGQIVMKKKINQKKAQNITTDEFYVLASSGISQFTRVKVLLEFGDFDSSNLTLSSYSLGARILTLLSIVLFLALLVALVITVLRYRLQVSKKSKPIKQVYSVSKGNIAIMADLNRQSPKFDLEKQLITLSSPTTARLSSSSSISHSSVISATKKQKLFGENISGEPTASHSMPDSGIDPDEMSVTSSVTDYLNQIGVTHNKMLDQKNSYNRQRFLKDKNNHRYDSGINELIYAKVDEILSSASRMNSPQNHFLGASFDVINHNARISETNAAPSFIPISELLLQPKNTNLLKSASAV